MKNQELIENFLRALNTEVDVCSHVDIEEIDFSNPFDFIVEQIEESNGFDIEIIYYSRAMEYLTNNDTSLRESLEIASELGYEVSSLGSEILASLLASRNAREEFRELQSEIEEFFESLEDEIKE